MRFEPNVALKSYRLTEKNALVVKVCGKLIAAIQLVPQI